MSEFVKTYKIIIPEIFKKVFLDSVENKRKEIEEKWISNIGMTDLMLSHGIEGSQDSYGIIKNISEMLGLQYYKEYWSLDAILHEGKHEKYFNDNACFAKHISIAIEHENVANYAHSEINKLSLFNSPLKVLITYPVPRTKNKLLGEFAEICCEADLFGHFQDEYKQVVIFGMKENGKIEWEFYVYTKDKQGDSGFIQY